MPRRKVRMKAKYDDGPEWLEVLVPEHSPSGKDEFWVHFLPIKRNAQWSLDTYKSIRSPSSGGHFLWYCTICGDVYPMNPKAKTVRAAVDEGGAGEIASRTTCCPTPGCETLYKLLTY